MRTHVYKLNQFVNFLQQRNARKKTSQLVAQEHRFFFYIDDDIKNKAYSSVEVCQSKSRTQMKEEIQLRYLQTQYKNMLPWELFLKKENIALNNIFGKVQTFLYPLRKSYLCCLWNTNFFFFPHSFHCWHDDTSMKKCFCNSIQNELRFNSLPRTLERIMFSASWSCTLPPCYFLF